MIQEVLPRCREPDDDGDVDTALQSVHEPRNVEGRRGNFPKRPDPITSLPYTGWFRFQISEYFFRKFTHFGLFGSRLAKIPLTSLFVPSHRSIFPSSRSLKMIHFPPRIVDNHATNHTAGMVDHLLRLGTYSSKNSRQR